MNELKELVSKGIEGGWGHECDYESGDPYRVRWETYGDGSASIGVIRDYSDDYVHVPDLINDDKFMKSVFGEEQVTMRLIINRHTIQAARCEIIKMNAITLSGDAQVKYLHKMMMEVGNGM